jgi:hypothetical protein
VTDAPDAPLRGAALRQPDRVHIGRRPLAAWLTAHGHPTNPAEAARSLVAQGFMRQNFVYRHPSEERTKSRSYYSTDAPDLVEGLPIWRGSRYGAERPDPLDEDDRPAGVGRTLATEQLAIERRAMTVVTEFYERRGYEVTAEPAGDSWDLTCRRAGQELRVEVKGTAGPSCVVEITAGELRRARAHPDLAVLAIVTDIITADGSVASGGTLAFIAYPWHPDAGVLLPTRFTHLPAGAPGRLRRTNAERS